MAVRVNLSEFEQCMIEKTTKLSDNDVTFTGGGIDSGISTCSSDLKSDSIHISTSSETGRELNLGIVMSHGGGSYEDSTGIRNRLHGLEPLLEAIHNELVDVFKIRVLQSLEKRNLRGLIYSCLDLRAVKNFAKQRKEFAVFRIRVTVDIPSERERKRLREADGFVLPYSSNDLESMLSAMRFQTNLMCERLVSCLSTRSKLRQYPHLVRAPTTFPLLFRSSAAGTLIHEICGHQLEGDIWYGELNQGEKVSNSGLMVRDNAMIAGMWGSYWVDDEGNQPSPVDLVRDGTITGMLLDERSSDGFQLPTNGHGRRRDYRVRPQVRISNLEVTANRVAGEIGARDGPSEGISITRADWAVTDASGRVRMRISEANLVTSGEVSAVVAPFEVSFWLRDALKAVGGSFGDTTTCGASCGKNGQWIGWGSKSPGLVLDPCGTYSD